MTTLTLADERRPGTYVLWSTAGALQIQILCPSCGHATSIAESEVDERGETWCKFECPYQGCSFLDVLLLAGYAEDAK